MARRRAIRIAVDAAMGVVLVALMATALVQEVPHEWLGIALFVLVVVHAVINRRWMAAVPRMRLDALRVLQVFVLVGLVACIVGQMVSSLVISKHAFGFLPVLPGAAWARRVHMICSYWLFLLAFAHTGLHGRTSRDAISSKAWALRVVVAAIACYGVYSFIKLNLWPYLTGQVQFAFIDVETPLALTTLRYASVAVLVAAVFHCIREGLLATKHHIHGKRS